MTSSLNGLLQSEELVDVVATVRTGIDAIAAVKQHRPDILILDIDMPMGRGTEVFGECRRWSPETRILILSGVREVALLHQLYSAGADAVLTKLCSRKVIGDAVRTVLDGGRFLDPELASVAGDLAGPITLTRREFQVLDLIAAGLTNAGIGERLGVSAKTIDGHRSNLMAKMDAHSVAELVVKAMRAGLLSGMIDTFSDDGKDNPPAKPKSG